MSFAALMVHFDGKPASFRRLRLAADLATRFGATLIGIAGRSYLPPFLADGNAAHQAKDEQQEMAVVLAGIGNRFRIATEHVARVEWRGSAADPTLLVSAEARAADLVIMGRTQEPGDLYYSLNPDTAVLRMGRPVLLVPEGIETLAAGRIVVAWKDAREARRAVRDTIPFLQRAQRVAIVEVCEPGSETQSQQSLNDLARYLARHDAVSIISRKGAIITR